MSASAIALSNVTDEECDDAPSTSRKRKWTVRRTSWEEGKGNETAEVKCDEDYMEDLRERLGEKQSQCVLDCMKELDMDPRTYFRDPEELTAQIIKDALKKICVRWIILGQAKGTGQNCLTMWMHVAQYMRPLVVAN